MTRRGLLSAIVVSAGLLTAACSSDPPTAAPGTTEPATTARPGGATGPGGATATSAPSLRQTPECRSFAAFKLAELAVVMGPPEQRDDALRALVSTAQATRQQVPQFTEQIDTYIAFLRASYAGSPPSSVVDAGRKAQAELANWYRATCLEDAAPGTTRPAT